MDATHTLTVTTARGLDEYGMHWNPDSEAYEDFWGRSIMGILAHINSVVYDWELVQGGELSHLETGLVVARG